MTHYIGIDPDTHDTSIAWCDAAGTPIGAAVVHVPKRKGVIRQDAVLEMLAALRIGLMRTIPSVRLIETVAVEAQTLQRGGIKQHGRPQDIVILGNVAGCILGRLSLYVGVHRILFPTPEEWKGQIPKAVMQARLYTKLGWGYHMIGGNDRSVGTYAQPIAVPKGFEHISAGAWRHVGDAMLLAIWASKQKSKQ